MMNMKSRAYRRQMTADLVDRVPPGDLLSLRLGTLKIGKIASLHR